jgi:hypothetical protein
MVVRHFENGRLINGTPVEPTAGSGRRQLAPFGHDETHNPSQATGEPALSVAFEFLPMAREITQDFHALLGFEVFEPRPGLAGSGFAESLLPVRGRLTGLLQAPGAEDQHRLA